MAPLRAVLDSKVLVSAIASPSGVPGRILNLWQSGAIEVALSHHILDETARVLPRLSKLNFSAEEARDLIDTLMLDAVLVEPALFTDPELRDPADQKILATLRAANADYLITGDKDLLALRGRYAILTPAEFWARHG